MKAVKVGLAVLAIGFGLPVWATTYYASPAGGGDGSSSESPTTLADAVAKATAEGAGAVVQLSAETFEMTAQTTIAADITVQGAGRDKTIVTKNASSKFRLFYLNSAGAVLKDMTVQNGYIDASGGNILIGTAGGLVTNCVIRNGYACNNGNGGSGIALKGGEVVDSVITNNDFNAANVNNHSCGAVYFTGCTKAVVRRCVIAYNKARCQGNGNVATAAIGVYDSNTKGVVIDSCTIAYNKAGRSGGIMSKCSGTIVTNCLFTGNVATRYSSDANDFYDNNQKIYDCFFDEGAAKIGTRGQTGKVRFDDDTFAPTFDSGNVGKAKDGADIGAVQHRTVTDATGYATVSSTKSVTGAQLGFFANGTDASANEPTAFVWDFGDGSDAESGQSVTHAYTEIGTYQPKVKITVGGVEKTVNGPSVAIGESDIYLTRGGDIQAAVNSAYPGATVHLGAGPYTLSTATTPYAVGANTAVTLDKPVRVIADSTNPYDTVITVSKSNTRAFYLGDPGALVAGVTIKGGGITTAYAYGGAAWLDHGTVSNCVFTSCTANGNGTGGSAVVLFADGLVTHTIISNNTSTITQNDNKGGGNVSMFGGTVRNCLIAKNTASNSSGKYINVGGVQMYGGTLESCTVAGNTGTKSGGVWVRDSSASVWNCAIHDNKIATESADAQYVGTGSYFHYCASTVAISGGDHCTNGTLNVTSVVGGDWHPEVGSAVIGAGTTGRSWMAEAKDLDGNPMIADGKTDAGCYQHQASYISGFLNADGLEGVAPMKVVLTASGQCEDPITSYVWTFGDGSDPIVTTTNVVSHTYDGVGVYKPSVKIVVASVSKSADFPLADQIDVGYAHFYVTDEENPGSAFPWSGWTTAATNLEEVIPFVKKGATVTLSAGTHYTVQQVNVKKAVRIEGFSSDPAETVLTLAPKSAQHRLFNLDCGEATICGIALQGDGAEYDVNGSVVLISSSGGTVSNCIVRGGRQCGNEIRGAGVHLTAGLLTHCVISNNVGASSMGHGHSGGAISIWSNLATVDYCLITGNRTWCGNAQTGAAANNGGIIMMNSGTVRNCTIVGNCAGKDGGKPENAGYGGIATTSLSNAKIQNCLIANNTSDGDVVNQLRRIADSAAIGVMSHCATDVSVGRTAQGCVFAEDMKFVDAANGDWRVHYESVAAKHADASVIKATKDLAGAPTAYLRNKADIGCYTRADKPGMVLLVK